jgi:hypothetical protein
MNHTVETRKNEIRETTMNNSFVGKERVWSHLVCSPKSGLLLTFACTTWLDVAAVSIEKHGIKF